MNVRTISQWLATLLCSLLPVTAYSGVSVGVTATDQGLNSFYLAVGDFYSCPQQQVLAVKSHVHSEDELPVVFFFARSAHVSPDAIIALRTEGKSWMEITLHFGFSPEIFYVPVQGTPGPPYGKAYGHYKNHKKSEWREIRFSDADVVNLVNLKFVSEHYDYAPEDVMKQRGSGKGFATISRDIEKSRTVSKAPESSKQDSQKSKDQGKDKSKSSQKPPR
jgi:hypothetical protein